MIRNAVVGGLLAGLLLVASDRLRSPASTMAGAHGASDPVIELRIYTIKPGRRDAFVRLFEEKGVAPQEAVGMRILGQFVSLEDDRTFVWLRAFPSEEERQRQRDRFYGSRIWKEELEAEFLPMIDDYSNVRLLRPTSGSKLR